MINLKIKAKHGFIDGTLKEAKGTKQKQLAIIINGLNGFSTYGMFPFIQDELLANGISSVLFNFSHGGIRGENDIFTELDLYESNSMKLEVLDIISIFNYLKENSIEFDELYLISHSLGSIPAVFAGKDIIQLDKNKLKGIILIAPSMNLDFWGDENMKKWKEQGYLIYDNKRTNQKLKLGKEYFNETLESESTWNLKEALSKTPVRYLIIHGEKDESIPMEESETINQWNVDVNNSSTLIKIPNANHNFNVTHKDKKITPEFTKLMSNVKVWLKEK